MRRANVTIAGSAAAVAVVLALGACSGEPARAPSAAESVTTPSNTTPDAAPATSPNPVIAMHIAELQANLEELKAQQMAERLEAQTVLTLPPGTSFSEPVPIWEIENQIRSLEELQSSGSPADVENPTLSWYEDGYFASLMAMDWRCAWLSTGIKQVEAGEDVTQTVETLHSFTSTEYAAAFPGYDRFLSNEVDPLLKGRTAAARSALSTCTPSSTVD